MFPPSARRQNTDDVQLHDGDAYHFPGLVFREADREVAISDEGGGVPSAAAGRASLATLSNSPLQLPSPAINHASPCTGSPMFPRAVNAPSCADHSAPSSLGGSVPGLRASWFWQHHGSHAQSH